MTWRTITGRSRVLGLKGLVTCGIALGLVFSRPDPAAAQKPDAGSLQEAVALYEIGQLAEARRHLDALGDTELSTRDRAVRDLYRRILALAFQEEEVARGFMSAALRSDPSIRLDPALHAPSRVQFFDELRRGVPAAAVSSATVAVPQQIRALVPPDWRADVYLQEDLNRDGRSDHVFVLSPSSSPGSIEPDSGRILGVALTGADGRVIFAERDRSLIPLDDGFWLADPLESLSIHNRAIRLTLHLARSVGGWASTTSSYVFRYQDNCFRLIGFDLLVLSRNGSDGSQRELSVNYPTRIAVATVGGVQRRETVPPQGDLPCLSKVSSWRAPSFDDAGGLVWASRSGRP